MTRLNIILPDEIARKLSNKHNKNSFIAEVLTEKFAQEKRKKKEQLLKEGYQATLGEDKNLNSEWEKASLEKWD